VKEAYTTFQAQTERDIHQKVRSIHDQDWRLVVGNKKRKHLFVREQLPYQRNEASLSEMLCERW